jgi:hypothetical protein
MHREALPVEEVARQSRVAGDPAVAKFNQPFDCHQHNSRQKAFGKICKNSVKKSRQNASVIDGKMSDKGVLAPAARSLRIEARCRPVIPDANEPRYKFLAGISSKEPFAFPRAAQHPDGSLGVIRQPFPRELFAPFILERCLSPLYQFAAQGIPADEAGLRASSP